MLEERITKGPFWNEPVKIKKSVVETVKESNLFFL